MLVIANLDHIKNVVLFSDYLLIVSPTWTLGFFHSEIPSTKIVADWACCERRNKTRKIGSMDEMSSFMNWNDELMKWNDEEGWLNQKGLWLLCTCNGSVKAFKRKREFWKLKNVHWFFCFWGETLQTVRLCLNGWQTMDMGDCVISFILNSKRWHDFVCWKTLQKTVTIKRMKLVFIM